MSARARLLLVTAVLVGLAAFLVHLRLERPGDEPWQVRFWGREKKEAVPAEAPAVVEDPPAAEPTPVPAPTEPWRLPFGWEHAAAVAENHGSPFEIEEAAAAEILRAPIEVAFARPPGAERYRVERLDAVRSEANVSGGPLAVSLYALPLLDAATRSVLVACERCPAEQGVLPTVLTRSAEGIGYHSSTRFGHESHVVLHAEDLNGDGTAEVILATGAAGDFATFLLWGRAGQVRLLPLGNGVRLWRGGGRTILEGRTWAARPDLGDDRPFWPAFFEWDGGRFADQSPTHAERYRIRYAPEQERALAYWVSRTDVDERTRRRRIAVHAGLLDRARAILEGRPLVPLEPLDEGPDDGVAAGSPAPASTPAPDPTPECVSTPRVPVTPTPPPPAKPTPRPTQTRRRTPRVDPGPVSACGVLVSAPVADAWKAHERTNGRLGCPKGDERDAAPSPFGTTGRVLEFPAGPGLPLGAAISRVTSGARDGTAIVTAGSIHGAWTKRGGTASKLGFPLSDEYAVPGGRRVDFEGGAMVLGTAKTKPRVVTPQRYVQDDDSRERGAQNRFLRDYDLLEKGAEADWVYLRDFDARRYRTVAVKPYSPERGRSEAGRLAEEGKRALEAAIGRATGLDAWTVVEGTADLVLHGNVTRVWTRDGSGGGWAQNSAVQELLGRDREGRVVLQMRHRSVGGSLRDLLSRGIGDFVSEMEARQKAWQEGR